MNKDLKAAPVYTYDKPNNVKKCMVVTIEVVLTGAFLPYGNNVLDFDSDIDNALQDLDEVYGSAIVDVNRVLHSPSDAMNILNQRTVRQIDVPD